MRKAAGILMIIGAALGIIVGIGAIIRGAEITGLRDVSAFFRALPGLLVTLVSLLIGYWGFRCLRG